jgi:hypothetical protein
MRRTKSGKADWSDFREEPEAWRELQERARNERDPKKLEAIIAEMNRLLTELEKEANGKGTRPRSRRGARKPAPIGE